nr:T9SS type A sorting domain-containing protein [Bacteroidota bacterium]
PVTLTNKHAKIELANDGTPLMIVMGWNESQAYWSAVKYNANGEVEYTINNQSGEAENAITDNNKNKITKIKKITLDNYPNPFNPTTKINYELPVERIGNSFYDVKLTVYNILGAEVATLVSEKQSAGSYSVTFNARLTSGQAADLSSGIYFYKLLLNGIVVDTKRMLLVK